MATKHLTVTFGDHTYGHQQMESLIRALRAEGMITEQRTYLGFQTCYITAPSGWTARGRDDRKNTSRWPALVAAVEEVKVHIAFHNQRK